MARPFGKTMTPLMRRFAEVYAGNGAEAARQAGYKGGNAVLATIARDVLRHPLVIEAIKTRECADIRPYIANRLERQAFWTSVMRGEVPGVGIEDRLAASEKLAKSEGDFILKVQAAVQHTMPQLQAMSVEELRALASLDISALVPGPAALPPGEPVDADFIPDPD